MPTHYVMPVAVHNSLVEAAFKHRGYTADESAAAARFCELAARHGIKTHNAIKALHLDELFGSKAGGCVPGAKIDKLPSRYKAVQRWNANRKLGQATAFDAMDTCMKLADEYGSGTVAVDNAFHYLWGGGYVIDAARKGYIAYTACTAALAEVVPFGGKFATLGTNPHSWAFPTTDALGFPICVDWATSTVAMGRVQQFLREGGGAAGVGDVALAGGLDDVPAAPEVVEGVVHGHDADAVLVGQPHALVHRLEGDRLPELAIGVPPPHRFEFGRQPLDLRPRPTAAGL